MSALEYAARIEAAKDDADELGRIAEELKALEDQASARLRMKAVSRRFVLLRAAGAFRQAPTRAVPQWLADLGLPPIDGRALYRYRLSDEGFEALQALLVARSAGLMFSPDKTLCAQFVLWAAEWFRRCYDGTGQRWDALGAPLGLRGSWTNFRRVADIGLSHWGIGKLQINGTHYRLAAIARQGGFPLAAVDGVGAGWAPRFLERLVGLLLGEPDLTLDAAEAIAATLMQLVPQTWRNQEIRIVSAELACEVVRLRRLVASEGAPENALISEWLDGRHPDWRDQLPIGVGSAAGRALIDGLMKTTVLKGGSGAVRVKRMLTIEASRRREWIELKLTGTLNDARGGAILTSLSHEWSRLRLFPSGEFARHVSGELATADPGDDAEWIARPTGGRTRFAVPGSVEIATELRGAGQRVGEPFILPGGEPLSAGARIYQQERSTIEGPAEFTLLGTGSGGYLPDRLHVDMPAAWTCAPHGEGASASVFPGGDLSGRTMWIVEVGAIVQSTQGDRYLIRAGQKGDQRDTLVLIGDVVPNCAPVLRHLPVYVGVPRIQHSEGRRERSPGYTESWWRPRGESKWRLAPDTASPGVCEFAWRDGGTGHVRDRREAIVLPREFKIERRRFGDWLELTVVGWPGRVEVDGGNKAAGGGWRFSMRGNARSKCTIRLLDAGAESIEIEVPLPHQAWLDHWTNGPVPRGGRISLSTLNHHVARSDSTLR